MFRSSLSSVYTYLIILLTRTGIVILVYFGINLGFLFYFYETLFLLHLNCSWEGKKNKEAEQLLLQMQLPKHRVLLWHRRLLSCSAEPINACPRFSQPLGFGGESWSQEVMAGVLTHSCLLHPGLVSPGKARILRAELWDLLVLLRTCVPARGCCPCRWALSLALCPVSSLAHF